MDHTQFTRNGEWCQETWIGHSYFRIHHFQPHQYQIFTCLFSGVGKFDLLSMLADKPTFLKKIGLTELRQSVWTWSLMLQKKSCQPDDHTNPNSFIPLQNWSWLFQKKRHPELHICFVWFCNLHRQKKTGSISHVYIYIHNKKKNVFPNHRFLLPKIPNKSAS